MPLKGVRLSNAQRTKKRGPAGHSSAGIGPICDTKCAMTESESPFIRQSPQRWNFGLWSDWTAVWYTYFIAAKKRVKPTGLKSLCCRPFRFIAVWSKNEWSATLCYDEAKVVLWPPQPPLNGQLWNSQIECVLFRTVSALPGKWFGRNYRPAMLSSPLIALLDRRSNSKYRTGEISTKLHFLKSKKCGYEWTCKFLWI